MNSMKLTAITTFLSALAFSALTAPAFAEDGKAMPGSACQASFLQAAQTLTGSGAFLLNTGTGTVKVTCPAVKDIEAGRIKRAQVKVVDRNPNAGADVSCTLTSHKMDGTVHQSQLLKSSGSSNNVQTLSYAGQSAAAAGTYSLVCDLPPFVAAFGPSSLVMYNLVEE